MSAVEFVQGEWVSEQQEVDAAFRSFYESHYRHACRTLALTLDDRHLAADAVQVAMVRAYHRWERVRDMDNPGGWVYRVALNWARRRYRRLARELLGRLGDTDRAVSGPSLPDPAVENALRQLPFDQRAVVVLRLYCDWSVTQVAETLDIPEGTVKSRHYRALARLREILEDDR